MNKLFRKFIVAVLLAAIFGASQAVLPVPLPKPKPQPDQINRTPGGLPSNPGKQVNPLTEKQKPRPTLFEPKKPYTQSEKDSGWLKKPAVSGFGAALAAAAIMPEPTQATLAKFYANDATAVKEVLSFLQTQANKFSHNPTIRGAITSDVYLDLIENPKKFEAQESAALASHLVAQLRSVANRMAKQQRTYAYRHQVVGAFANKDGSEHLFLDEAVSPGLGPEQTVESQQFVRHVFSLLTKAESDVLRLRLEGYTAEESAAKLGKKSSAVSSALRDAKDRIPADVMPRTKQQSKQTGSSGAASGAGT